jgi:hypothetical protein
MKIRYSQLDRKQYLMEQVSLSNEGQLPKDKQILLYLLGSLEFSLDQ